MHKRLVATLLVAFALVFAQQGWALEMESGEGSSRIHMHGYGELHYSDPEGDNFPDDKAPSRMDFHRMVWGFSIDVTDSISIHTEVDFEHAATEMELEFAYIDFLITPAFNIRAGDMLMPVGPLNEFHEPPLFYSVERPKVETFLIPTTWQEGGFGFFGSPMEGLNYRVYLVSSLNAEGFESSKGIREGRGHVAEADSDDLAVVGRLEYSPVLGVDLGLSLYSGGANASKNPALGSPDVMLYEGDVRVRMGGVDFRAEYVKIDVDGADKITQFRCDSRGASASPATTCAGAGGISLDDTVGEEMFGWNVEIAYHLQKVMGTSWDLVPFVRREEFDTHDKVPTGTTADPENDREVTTYGLAFFPHPQIAVKADFEDWEDGAGRDETRFNLGLAYMF